MSTVSVAEQGGIVTLSLNRPEKLNALCDDMIDAFFATLDGIARSSARVVVITGSGRGFCSGFDLSLASGGDEEDEGFWARRQERFGALVTRLRAIPQPTIAAVNGAATGAGLGLALACDTRIGSAAARFSSAFIRVGMSSCDVGVSWLLPRAIGTTRAFEMMLTGRMVEADEAERIGLIARRVHPDELLDQARALARSIAENGRMGTWMTKRGMWANLEIGSLQAAIELENRTQTFMLGTGGLARRAAERGFVKPKS
ncbi:enoyl-CoA hydratase [Mesorhizobium sp. L-8-10]|uniref:enoyl-CoA hydratase/isomerase family protein n=1 Tax=Mesorhizobium sp. L-8-10 TaxID=2744523 RepID=UPI001926A75B|nr:enoyl-CoA hydratase/isomerase family protein [Mesorhizobium sp. L-8-10]BCH31234.1 enoyl-CoA hydratase [Mesorhizobium sp. L-8-10]